MTGPSLSSGTYPGRPKLGSAAQANIEDFATAAQGGKADTAVQPADFDPVAAKANSALQEIREGSGVTVDATDPQRPIISAAGGTGAVESVNGKTGEVVLDASDVGAATAAQGALAQTAVQPDELALVAETGNYGDLSGKPTLGTAAAANTSDFAAAVHTHTASQISDASANGRSILTAADYAAMKALLDLEIGTDVQAYNAKLAALAGLSGAADKLAYFTGASSMSLADLSAFVRGILGSANAAAFRTAIGAVASPYSLGSVSTIPSAVAAVDIAVDSTKKSFEVEFTAVRPATDTVNFQILADIGSAGTYNASISSVGNTITTNNNFFTFAAVTTGCAIHSGSPANVGNAANEYGVYGKLHFSQISSAYIHFQGVLSYRIPAGTLSSTEVSGEIITTSPITGLRFKYSSGNIVSGQIALVNLD